MQWLMFNACSTELAVSSRPNEACRHTAEGLLPFFGWGRRGRKLGEGREEEWGLVLSVSKLGPVTSQGPKHVLSSSFFQECVCVFTWAVLVVSLLALLPVKWIVTEREREKYKRVKVVLKNSLLDSLMSSSHYCTILLYHFYANFSLTLYISLCGCFLIILISYI